MQLFIFFILLVGICISCAEFSRSTKEIFDEIYSSGKMNEDSASDLINKINQTSFERESHRVMALLQVRSSTENSEMLREAKDLALSYLNSGAENSEKKLVEIGLSTIFSLSGERMVGCKLAEEILKDVDFKQLAKENKSYVDYVIGRYNIGSIGPERFFKDELRRQIGGYYLNRKDDEGGPDVQKAYDVFSRISVQEIRDSCLFDARLRGLKQSAPIEDSVAPDLEKSATTNFDSVKPASQLPPVVQPPTPTKAHNAKLPAPSERPISSTPWIIVMVLVMAAVGLLWLVLKKRK